MEIPTTEWTVNHAVFPRILPCSFFISENIKIWKESMLPINRKFFGDYLEISMTGLFAVHVSFDDFHRYQFSQWNFLFRKTIWNIYHHQNQPLSELDEYFCHHAFPRLILKKNCTSKGCLFFNAAPNFGPSASTNKACNIHSFCC